MRVEGELHAVEQHFFSSRHAEGGKVFDVGELTELVGSILDVHPAEFDARELVGEREKTRAILNAGIAPLRAQARHDELCHG